MGGMKLWITKWTFKSLDVLDILRLSENVLYCLTIENNIIIDIKSINKDREPKPTEETAL